MIILIGSIFAGIIAQIAVNIAGYNSKGIAMLIFLTVLGISLITTAGSKNEKVNRGIIMEKYSKERLEKKK